MSCPPDDQSMPSLATLHFACSSGSSVLPVLFVPSLLFVLHFYAFLHCTSSDLLHCTSSVVPGCVSRAGVCELRRVCESRQGVSAWGVHARCRVERSLLWETTGSLAATGNDLRVGK